MSYLGGRGVYLQYKKDEYGDISFDIYHELLDSINFDYVDMSSTNVKYQDDVYYNSFSFFKNESSYDEYNGYYLDEFGEPDCEKHRNEDDTCAYIYETEEPLELVASNTFHYIVIGAKYDLYSCDNCGCKFMDKNDYYADKKERSKFTGGIVDLCCDCLTNEQNRVKKKVAKRNWKELMQNGVVATSRQQIYLSNLYEGDLNHNIGDYYVDILLADNIVIEYDGSGHWLKSHYSNSTIEEIDSDDINRDRDLISKGYKVVRIISRKDLLPSDEDLMDLLYMAQDSFANGKDKVVFDIDEIGYEYLRKITENDI